MYKYVLACLLLASLRSTYAQNNSIAPLLVNEPLPNLHFTNVMGYDKPTLNMQDLKGKLVILDFWMTTCKSCILGFPHMEALQKRFGDSLQIILVAPNSKADIINLFTKVKRTMPQLPMIYSDSILQNYFPYVTVPQHVWIDKHGRMYASTESSNTTEENIAALLQGEQKHFVARQEAKDFDWKQPLLTPSSGRGLATLQYYSVFLKRLDLYRGSRMLVDNDTADGRVGLKLLNMPLSKLYTIAYGNSPEGGPFELPSTVAYETRDSNRFIMPENNNAKSKWKEENSFCYESSLPAGQQSGLYELLREDLQHYLPYKGSVEKRTAKCFVLKCIADRKAVIANPTEKAFSGKSGDQVVIRNLPIINLVNSIRYAFQSAVPIIDETGMKENISLSINGPMNQLLNLKKELLRYGLTIDEEERVIDMLVIRDTNVNEKNREPKAL